MPLTKSKYCVHQINFSYDEEGNLIGLTAHGSQAILDNGKVLTTHAETINIDAHVTPKQRAVLVALIEKLVAIQA